MIRLSKNRYNKFLLITMTIMGVLSLIILTCQIAYAKQSKDNKQIEKEFFRVRAFQNGKAADTKSYDKALKQWKKIPKTIIHGPHKNTVTQGLSGAAMSASAVTSLTGTVWNPIGPSPINQKTSQVNGRVSAISVHPFNQNVIYQGASGGGLWRTIDGGATWTPLYDQMVSLGVGEPSAVSIDPNDPSTIYVGTSGRFVMNISKGILKSTDGGGSWIVLGSDFPANNTGNADDLFANNQSISVIIVDPANSNNLYLGATNGLFFSTDAGQNWTQGTNGGGDARSLVLDTTSPVGSRILYAGISGSGVRQSIDGGQTWTQILNAATPAVNTALAGGSLGHVVVDLAPPASPPNAAGIQVLYVTMTGGNGAPDPVGIFQSTNQGTNWVQQSATGLSTGTQGGYDLTMGVDPASPGDGVNDIIYLGAVGQFKSTDSGDNFTTISNGQHVDSHAGWVFFPQISPTPSTVWTGNDGGIFRSDDGGATWTGTGLTGAPATINAGGLQTGLFYNLDVKNDATASVTVGALQDNGTPRTTGTLAWTDTQGGDGWDVAWDSQITNNAYNSSGFWPTTCTRVFKSTDGIATFPPTVPFAPGRRAEDVTPWLFGATDQGCYNAPVNADPSLGDVIYASGNQNLWQTQDGASNWRIILNTGATAQVKVAEANSNIVAAAVGPQVFVSTNALAAAVGPPSGVTFTNITRNLPNRGVSRVAIDPIDPTVIYVTLGGFNNQTPGSPGHVFRTSVGGTTWEDISPPLDVPFNAIVLDGTPAPTTIYVGTDLGVMRSIDGGSNWSVLDDVHFPNVPVTDFALNTQAGVLRASTYGRGVFELAQPDGPVIAVNTENGLDFTDQCPGSTDTLTLQVFNVGIDDLVINSVQNLMGSSSFSVAPNPSTPLVISPNAEVDFTVIYSPDGTSTSDQATIRISSNDPSAPAFDLTATGSIGEPDINTSIADSGNFGNVCQIEQKDLNLQIINQGNCDLTVTNIASADTDNYLVANVQLPLVLSPDAHADIPIRFQPDDTQVCNSTSTRNSMITINSNDPDETTKIQTVTGTVPCPTATTSGDLDFGELCIGESETQAVQVCDTGSCNLTVTDASLAGTDCDDLTLVSPLPADLPLTISPDFCFDFVVKFEPDDFTAPTDCSLVVDTDDPNNPMITLPITASVGEANIVIDPAALDGLYAFPATVTEPGDLGCYSERPLVIRNNGTCPLDITAINATAPFSVVAPTQYPVTIPPGEETLDVTVRFDPTTGGGSITAPDETTGTLTVISNDPDGPETAGMCGEAVVQSGVRVLMEDFTDTPIEGVDSLTLKSFGIHAPGPVNIKMKDVPVNTTTVCSNTVQYHMNREDLPPTETSGTDPNASYNIRGKEGNKQTKGDFTLGQCEFKEFILRLR
jgi:hypothetical protein